MFKVVVIDTSFLMHIKRITLYDDFLNARFDVFEKFEKNEIRLIVSATTNEIVAVYERVNDHVKEFFEVNSPVS